jgi:uncharacterized protein
MAERGKSSDLMGYAALEQEALRAVVRAALKRAAADGLPGEHQFMITFKTKAPGVSGPPEVMARYPDEMMVVFKPNQFRDLAPGETFFSVTLSFSGQPRSLSVPYVAITEFEDPAVGYRLSFSVAEQPPALTMQPHRPAQSEPRLETKDPDKPNIVSLDQFRKK